MAQATPRYCPRCGTPTRANMSYCPTCELPVEAMLSRPDNGPFQANEYAQGAMSEPANVPTSRYSPQENQPYHTSVPQDFLPTWQAPGEQPYFSQPSFTSSVSPDEWGVKQQPPHTLGASPGQAMPQWQAPAQKPPERPRGRRRGNVVLILLVLLLALGGGGYLAISVLHGHIPGINTTQSTIKTTSLGIAMTYAGLDITLLSTQQAQNFIDDPQTTNDGMLRLHLQEDNKTAVPIIWDYNTSMHLLVQGKPATLPTYVKEKGNLAPGATSTSIVDFAVTNGGNLSTMILQVGTNDEAQLQIPLNGQGNLNQYQPKTTKQNGSMVYFGLNWTLTSSTSSLNIPGRQASKGMEYLTISLTVDSTLSQEAIAGSPFDYLRIKAGGQTATPLSTTLPVSFAANETGKTGTATFLIPQNSATCTLLMLSQDPGGSGQASTDFQL